MKTLVLTPPTYEALTPEQKEAGSVFLAGTIEMGSGENWQPRAIKAFSGKVGAIFNPRREDWDSTWKQSISNQDFTGQVNWELDHIEAAGKGRAGVGYFYFDPESKSPITLLELGLVGGAKMQAVVCCPKGFWRRGNIEIVCARYGIPLYDNFEESIGAVLTVLRTL
jgi:hypothetical protein